MAFGMSTADIGPVEKEKVQGQPSAASMRLAYAPKKKKGSDAKPAPPMMKGKC